MAGFIPDTIIDEIHERCDIVEVISSYIPLRRAGANFKALCPFHHEKAPSFMVNPAKQIFRCFGCGVGGNVFTFIMKYERMEFPEVVEILAKKAGVTIPSASAFDSERQSRLRPISEANELAAKFYHHTLKSERGLVAYRYLKNRNLTDEIIDTFGLGYAPDSWDGFLKFASARGIKMKALEAAGLILAKEGGGHYDRFRGRIIFPIFDSRSKVIGFGGRVVDESLPKYINSPETEVFSKGRHLYGLNFAKHQIQNQDLCVIVEGYLDLISAHQHGVSNVVASLGTALTTHQARMLKRYTQRVVIVYDGDQAGEAASLRGLDLLIQEDLNVGVVSLPRGYDPDSFIRSSGIDDFKTEVESARDLFDYKLGLLVSKYDIASVEGKVKIASEMLPIIAKVTNAIRKSGYVKQLAQKLFKGDRTLGEELILAELKKVKTEYGYYDKTTVSRPKQPARRAEKILAGLMLESSEFINEVKSLLDPTEFIDSQIRELVDKLFELASQGKTIEPSKLINRFPDNEIIVDLLTSTHELVDKPKSLQDCIEWIKTDNKKHRLNRLQTQIELAQNTGDDNQLRRLVAEYNELIKAGARKR